MSNGKACVTRHQPWRADSGTGTPSNSKRRRSMRDTVTQTEIRHARRTERTDGRTDGRRWGGWESVPGGREDESGRQTATERTSAAGVGERGLISFALTADRALYPVVSGFQCRRGWKRELVPQWRSSPLFRSFFLSLTIGGHANTRARLMNERGGEIKQERDGGKERERGGWKRGHFRNTFVAPPAFSRKSGLNNGNPSLVIRYRRLLGNRQLPTDF